MVGAIESDFLHCAELLILVHFGFLDLASHVVEVSHFELVGHSFFVLLAVQDPGEDLQLSDGLEREFDDGAGHAHLLETLD